MLQGFLAAVMLLAVAVSGLRVFPAASRVKVELPLAASSPGSGHGFGSGSMLPRPKIITPSVGSANTQLEKFLMMYTCKICQNRNAQMVSKVAYNQGMVVSTCRQCKSKHLIADNEGKLDMGEYGRKIEQYLEQKGEKVQHMTITAKDLENNYLVDHDGVVALVSKQGGQLDAGLTVIDIPSASNPSPPRPQPPSNSGGGFKTTPVAGEQ
jgi:transcription elongation factor Elf1